MLCVYCLDMALTKVAYSDEKDSERAGLALAEQIDSVFNGVSPSAVVVFASSSYSYPELLAEVQARCAPEILVGCSSAGEYVSSQHGTEGVSAVAIKSDDMEFRAVLARGISKDWEGAVETLLGGLTAQRSTSEHWSALILADALSGYTDRIISTLTEKTAGAYQFFGGGAGDNANFKETHVFLNDQVATDAVVMLEIKSKKPVGVGVHHGWDPVGAPMRVTEIEGMQLKSLNAIAAVEVFKEHAARTGQAFNPESPIPFFLHNILGIETPTGYKLRVPLSCGSDGSVQLASDIPVGSVVSFMSTEPAGARHAAEAATEAALLALEGNTPGVAFFFDCVATRLRLGSDFEYELQAVRDSLHHTSYVGCNTYGQVARVDGQFSGFHNCTAVVCILPD